MNDNAITLQVRGATLLAVPAVHFRLPFAEAVNAVCRDPATRPDAIAVELGPAAAMAARAWLLELGLGPGGRRRLPCMLALHRKRRLLHPSVRERAAALQRETGRELHRLPPKVLQEELGFSGLAVLQLSPTDSIVEALRCSCELDVPVYGVDLEESADREPAESLIEDPWLARGAVRAFAESNARRAASGFDPVVDERREAVMAARLASVLARHRRVLFTGGLGHWTRLAALLQSASLQPASVGLEPDETEVASWTRTIVHPGIAANHMEWPAVTWCWERNRPHPLRAAPVRDRLPPNHQDLLAKKLEQAYRRATALSEDERRRAASDCARFAQLLAAESQLSLRQVPGLGLVLRCAEVALPKAFAQALGTALVRFPWAKPARFRDIEVLGRSNESAIGEVTLAKRGGRYQAASTQGGATMAPDDRLIRVAESQWERHVSDWWLGWSVHWSWRPWERLATALSAQASGQFVTTRRVTVAEPFSGQLLDGIDVRGTLREYARGQDRLIVRDSRGAPGLARRTVTNAFPVVWIFDGAEPRGGQLVSLRTPLTSLLQAAEDRAALERLRDAAGDDLLDLLLFTHDRSNHAGSASDTTTGYKGRGWVLFRPQCPTLRQAADWTVRTQSRLRPTYSHGLGDALPQEIRQALERDGGPRLGDLTWQDSLLRVALAFGGRTVTLVAPSGFSPAPSIHHYAQRRGQTIGRVPLSAFPPGQVTRIRSVDLVSGRIEGDEGRIVYNTQSADALGESEDAYRELVPPEWRRFLW